MNAYDERATERHNDASDVRSEIADSRAADLVEYLATERPAFNIALDDLVTMIKEDETALAAFVQFMAQRSTHRRYATRKTVLAYEIALEATRFVDRFLGEYVESAGRKAPDLFSERAS